MTAAAVDAISTLEIRVPEDLSLIGFDDLDWMRFYRPPVTAVAQPLTTIGETAAHLVLDRIAGNREPPKHVALMAELVERETIAPARKASRNSPGGIPSGRTSTTLTPLRFLANRPSGSSSCW